MKKRVGLFKWQVGTFFLANSTVQLLCANAEIDFIPCKYSLD